MQTLPIASRKGLFVVRGHDTQWAIAAHQFAGDPTPWNVEMVWSLAA